VEKINPRLHLSFYGYRTVNLINQTKNYTTVWNGIMLKFALLLNNGLNFQDMEKKAFQFRTNINCGGCVASVKLHLDKAEGICEWDVDIASKDKILTVKTEGIAAEQVSDIIKKAGFKAEALTA